MATKVILVVILFLADQLAAQTHIAGVLVVLSCPLFALQGETIQCTVTIENQDVDHPATVRPIVEQPLGFGNFTAIRSCTADPDGNGEFLLLPNDGVSFAGDDFTSCEVFLCSLFAHGLGDFPVGVVVEAFDADPIPVGSGGFGGLVTTTSNSSVVGSLGPPFPTRTFTPTPTPTPGEVPTITCADRNLGNTAAPGASGSTLLLGNRSGGASCGEGGDEAPDFSFFYTPPVTAVYAMDTRGSDFDTVLYVRDGTCDGLELACNDDVVLGTERQSRLHVPLVAGQEVVIVVDGWRTEGGNFLLHVRPAQPTMTPTATPTRPTPTPTRTPDMFEPDGSPEQAAKIDCGDVQSHSLSPRGDIDWSRFALDTTSEVTIRTTGGENDRGTLVRLLDERGEVIELGSFVESLTSTFSRVARDCSLDPLLPGSYFLSVESLLSRNVESYQVTLTCRPCE